MVLNFQLGRFVVAMLLLTLIRALDPQLSSLPEPAPHLAPAPSEVEIPVIDFEFDFKYVNTKNYYSSEKHGVTAEDNVYTLHTDSSFTCTNAFQNYFLHSMHTLTIGGEERLVVAERAGALHIFPLRHTATLTCPETLPVLNGNSTSVSMDFDRNVGVFMGAYVSGTNIEFSFRLVNLQTTNYSQTSLYSANFSYPHEYCNDLSRSLTTIVALGTDSRSVVVFMPEGFYGITAYYGSIDGDKLTSSDISTGTPLTSALGCFRMTRIGVSDPLSTTTTVTLAVACANDGTGKPAVYVVQVPVVAGVPQTLKVTASIQMEKSDVDQASCIGGISYLDGSLLISTNHRVYNYMITNPESNSPTITLRSYFASMICMSTVSLLTPDVGVVGGWHSSHPYVGPAVLNVAEGRVIQGFAAPTGYELSNKLISHPTTIESIIRLSGTSFVTAGGNREVRRWESCAGLGYDYTTAIRNTISPYSATTTCGCPADMLCLLGTSYSQCPVNTVPVGNTCQVNGGFYPEKSSLSLEICPRGYACTNGIKSVCTANFFQDQVGMPVCAYAGQGFFTTPEYEIARTSEEICPAGHKCVGGVRIACEVDTHQPYRGSSSCTKCPISLNTGGMISQTSCNYVSPGFYVAHEGAVVCPAGHFCPGGCKDSTLCTEPLAERFLCLDNTYQPLFGQTNCWVCPENSTANDEHTSCMIQDGYYISKGSLDTDNAETQLCPAGYACHEGFMNPCRGDMYQPDVGQHHCLMCHSSVTDYDYYISHPAATVCLPRPTERCFLSVKTPTVEPYGISLYQTACGFLPAGQTTFGQLFDTYDTMQGVSHTLPSVSTLAYACALRTAGPALTVPRLIRAAPVVPAALQRYITVNFERDSFAADVTTSQAPLVNDYTYWTDLRSDRPWRSADGKPILSNSSSYLITKQDADVVGSTTIRQAGYVAVAGQATQARVEHKIPIVGNESMFTESLPSSVSVTIEVVSSDDVFEQSDFSCLESGVETFFAQSFKLPEGTVLLAMSAIPQRCQPWKLFAAVVRGSGTSEELVVNISDDCSEENCEKYFEPRTLLPTSVSSSYYFYETEYTIVSISDSSLLIKLTGAANTTRSVDTEIHISCDGPYYTANKSGAYVDWQQACVCMFCPAGHRCLDGVKTACTNREYQPLESKTTCLICPNHSTVDVEHTSCTVNSSYYISTGSLEDNNAKVEICPAGYKCSGGAAQPVACTGTEYQDKQGMSSCEPVTAGHYTTPEGASARTGQTKCPAGYKCVDGARTECDNSPSSRQYQDETGKTVCKSCSDEDHYKYLATHTSITCNYCPDRHYLLNDRCEPCGNLAKPQVCTQIIDSGSTRLHVLDACILHKQWWVDRYQCRYCHSDETCNDDYTFTWKFKANVDPETISGKILIAVIVVSLIILSALAFWLAYYLRHKGLSRRSAGANAKVEAEAMEMIQI